MADSAHVQVQAPMQVSTSTWGLRVSDHQAQWPAALLTGLGAPWNTLQADGQLHTRTQGLQLHWAQGRMQMQGLAELQLDQLSTRLSPIRPIGSYLLKLGGTAEGTPTPSVQLSTLQGPLMLTGEGQWVGARLRFTGEGSAQEGHEPALNNLLNILGRRQGARSLISWG
jgi:general secretion pathway protein N